MIIPLIKAKHYCENEVEYLELKQMGIDAEIRPMIFDDIAVQFAPCFSQSDNPHVYISAHKGRREEYGINFVEGIASTIPEVTFHIYGVNGRNKTNIIYHGRVSEIEFNEQIIRYHAALRLNSFDGFGEVLAKSLLLGQSPISTIYYPFIDYAKNPQEILALLRGLKDKKKPNKSARDYWLKTLNNNLYEITHNWTGGNWKSFV